MLSQTHHRCRITGCLNLVENHFLFCGDHQRLIPDKTQEDLRAAYKQATRDNFTEGDVRRYTATVQDAVDTVEARAACSRPCSGRSVTAAIIAFLFLLTLTARAGLQEQANHLTWQADCLGQHGFNLRELKLFLSAHSTNNALLVATSNALVATPEFRISTNYTYTVEIEIDGQTFEALATNVIIRTYLRPTVFATNAGPYTVHFKP